MFALDQIWIILLFMPSKGNATWSIATAFSGCRISHLHITPSWDMMLPKSNRLDTQIQTPHPYQLLYVQSSKYNVKKNDTKRSSPTKQITAGKQAFYLTFLDVMHLGWQKGTVDYRLSLTGKPYQSLKNWCRHYPAFWHEGKHYVIASFLRNG